MSEIIKIKCIKHVFPDQTEVSICGLDFVVNKGERVIILGPNGTGKTTLLLHILGLLKPVDGEVKVLGLNPSKDFKKLREKIGIVFQNVDEQIIGPTVYEDIAFSLLNYGKEKDLVEQRVKSIARQLDIEQLLDKVPHYLSGGQKKKVALAGAITMEPELLILDEPFDGLDPKSKRDMIETLNVLNSKGVTTIITTHDINIVPDIADMIYIINKGSIITKGKPDEIFKQVEILKEANLEPPILIQLFNRLQKNGLNVDIPINIQQAESEIYKLIKPV